MTCLRRRGRSGCRLKGRGCEASQCPRQADRLRRRGVSPGIRRFTGARSDWRRGLENRYHPGTHSQDFRLGAPDSITIGRKPKIAPDDDFQSAIPTAPAKGGWSTEAAIDNTDRREVRAAAGRIEAENAAKRARAVALWGLTDIGGVPLTGGLVGDHATHSAPGSRCPSWPDRAVRDPGRSWCPPWLIEPAVPFASPCAPALHAPQQGS